MQEMRNSFHGRFYYGFQILNKLAIRVDFDSTSNMFSEHKTYCFMRYTDIIFRAFFNAALLYNVIELLELLIGFSLISD